MTARGADRRTVLAEATAVGAVIVAGVVAATSVRGCGGAHASPAQCDEIRARYVEARVRQLDPAPSAATLARSQAASSRAAGQSARFARCAETVREDAAKCALEAGDADAIERCLQ